MIAVLLSKITSAQPLKPLQSPRLKLSGDRQNARFQHVFNAVRDMCRGTAVGDQVRKNFGEAAPSLCEREKHDAAVGGKPPAIESGCDFLARHRWTGDSERVIVGHGGCGFELQRAQDGFDTHFLRKFNALRHPRQHPSKQRLNKSG
jgi:hypothetical protein